MKNYDSSPIEMFACAWQHRQLITSLVKREVVGRYRGSVLGVLWSFFNPIFMLSVYTFIFSVVFKARWGSTDGGNSEFALILFAGLLVFNLFSECVSRAPSLITSNVNYVKKIVFPLEVLPYVVLGAALFHMLVNFCVWLLFYLIFFGLPKLSALLFPLTILPLVFLALGASWLLASLGVFIRDIGQIVNLAVTILLFMSPIFYPMSALPPNYQIFLQLNPLAIIVEQVRDVLIWGNSINIFNYIAYLAVTFIVAVLGFMWFQKTRKGFADVI